MNSATKFAAVYIRVSTERQEELSPNAQLRLAKDYASQNNLTILEEHIYMDIGISGKQAENRPQFQEMIATAKQKDRPFDVVLLWKFSRFARSQDEAAYYKSILRKKCNVDVISITEPIMEGMYGRLIEMIIEWNDEFYSYNLSQEVWKGMSEKALQGGYQARPPIGYRIAEKKKPPIVVPKEAELIKFIYQQYTQEGKSMFEIARELNELGFTTARGNAFERRSIDYILNNPIYCGYVRWNRMTNSKKQLKPPDEWIIAKGSHEAIISEEIFQLAQTRRQKESGARRTRPSSTYKHWLSGLLICPACGRVMICSHTSQRQNKKRYYNFVCSGYCKGTCTQNNQISALRAESAVLEALSIICARASLRYGIKKSPDEDLNVSICTQQLQQLDRKLDRIKAAYENGIDALEEYKKEKKRLLSEKNKIKSKIDVYNAQSEQNKKENASVSLIDPYSFFNSNQIDAATKNQSLKNIIEKIIYQRQTNKAELYFKV